MDAYRITQRKEQVALLIAIAFVSLVVGVNSANLNLALPTMALGFQADIAQVSWVLLIFLLCLGGFMVIAGRIGDIVGFRKVMVVGALLLAAGSLLCGAATGLWQLIALRVIMAIGAAMMTAMCPAVVSGFLPTRMRGKGMGIVELFFSVGIALGMVLGGIITAKFGWRWILFGNIPALVVTLLLTLWGIPVKQPRSSERRFDALGAFLLMASMLPLLYAFNQGKDVGWASLLIIGSILLAIVLLIAFIAWERRIAYPILDVGLFARRNFTLANASIFLGLLVMLGTLFVAPFYLETTRGLSANLSGLVLGLPSVMLIITCPLSGHLSDTIGPRWIAFFGMGLCAVTCYLMSLYDQTTSLTYIIVTALLFGTSFGIFVPPVASAIMGEAPADKQGMVSSAMMLVRNTGGVMGVSIFSAIYSASIPAGALAEIDPAALVPGISHTLLAAVLISALAAVFIAFYRTPQVPS